MIKNIFIIGLDDFHLAQLQGLDRAKEYRFHSLASYTHIKCGERFPVPEFLDKARKTLEQFNGSIDAVVGFWDFPVSTMLPIIQQWFGLRGASLSAVLKCEHKFWSRLEQQNIVPTLIPDFQAVDPFAEDAVRQCRLPYPYWIKPVKSVLSHLGFLINNSTELTARLGYIQSHIGRYAVPFNYLLSFTELPPEVKNIDGFYCIAEELISQGHQCTLEGYVFKGDVQVYGIVDSIREGQHHSCFSRYQYPSTLPKAVTERMILATRRVLNHIGYDNSPFNIEFYWNSQHDTIRLLEINTRISKSHCPLFKLVDGEFHHQVMLDVALGQRPNTPHREGKFRTAAKFMVRSFHDGHVVSVPDAVAIQRVRERFPGIEVLIHVEPGMQLSELRDQDSYSYEIADVFIGANSDTELVTHYREILDMLPFIINPAREAI